MIIQRSDIEEQVRAIVEDMISERVFETDEPEPVRGDPNIVGTLVRYGSEGWEGDAVADVALLMHPSDTKVHLTRWFRRYFNTKLSAELDTTAYFKSQYGDIDWGDNLEVLHTDVPEHVMNVITQYRLPIAVCGFNETDEFFFEKA